uniref:Uncharacterized protein n=1 Tax=Romanomermis culicivorax TaxID=13658 RepID=A0A915I7U3_ROMCU
MVSPSTSASIPHLILQPLNQQPSPYGIPSQKCHCQYHQWHTPLIVCQQHAQKHQASTKPTNHCCQAQTAQCLATTHFPCIRMFEGGTHHLAHIKFLWLFDNESIVPGILKNFKFTVSMQAISNASSYSRYIQLMFPNGTMFVSKTFPATPEDWTMFSPLANGEHNIKISFDGADDWAGIYALL